MMRDGASRRYDLKDAVDWFREDGMSPVHVDGPCPYCKEASLEFHSVDVDTRIELRLGGHRMALCLGCSSFVVIFAPVAATKNILKAGLLTTKRKRTPEEIEADTKYDEMLHAWYKKNGWAL